MIGILNAEQAAQLIEDNWTVACAGFVGAGHAEAVTTALEERFLSQASPRNLTLIYSAGQGDRGSKGVNHFGHEGLTNRIIGGHWRSAPKLSALALANKAEAFNLPQGVISHLYRAIAGNKPGVITKIGLHTFVDPRHGGGKLNTVTTVGQDLVELITIAGEEYLRYIPIKVNCTLLRGTSADVFGNITCEDEAFHHELLAIAQAARNSGGLVIAQVKYLSDKPALPNDVRVPGILIDYVVPVGDDPITHAMTFAEQSNPSYTQPTPVPVKSVLQLGTAALLVKQGTVPKNFAATTEPLTARLLAQRRAALEIEKSGAHIVNLGVGMPANAGALALQAGIDQFVLTVEAGPIGGTPADGLSFGASSYPQAIVDQPAQFDFYDGGGIDLAILGIGEFDVHGNVNVSMFGQGQERLIAGVGGFINITQSTKRLVFVGTLTASGLEVAVRNGDMSIVKEGRVKKLVDQVSHLSFNAPYVKTLGAQMIYITERAVFELDDDGFLVLTEIAPGLDLQRDVLDQCPASIRVSKQLITIDQRVFA